MDSSRNSNIQPGLPGSPRPRGSPLAMCAPQGKESVGPGLACSFLSILASNTYEGMFANLSLEARETVQEDVYLLWDSRFPQDHKTQEVTCSNFDIEYLLLHLGKDETPVIMPCV